MLGVVAPAARLARRPVDGEALLLWHVGAVRRSQHEGGVTPAVVDLRGLLVGRRFLGLARQRVFGGEAVGDVGEADREGEAVVGFPVHHPTGVVGQGQADVNADREAGDAAFAHRLDDCRERHPRRTLDVAHPSDDPALRGQGAEMDPDNPAEHEGDLEGIDGGVAAELEVAAAPVGWLGDQEWPLGAGEAEADGGHALVVERQARGDQEAHIQEGQAADLDDPGVVDVAGLDPREPVGDQLDVEAAAARRHPALQRLQIGEQAAQGDASDPHVEVRAAAVLGLEARGVEEDGGELSTKDLQTEGLQGPHRRDLARAIEEIRMDVRGQDQIGPAVGRHGEEAVDVLELGAPVVAKVDPGRDQLLDRLLHRSTDGGDQGVDRHQCGERRVQDGVHRSGDVGRGVDEAALVGAPLGEQRGQQASLLRHIRLAPRLRQ